MTGVGLRVYSLGFQIYWFPFVGVRSSVKGVGCRVQGAGYRV
jgi:hypothetical protein